MLRSVLFQSESRAERSQTHVAIGIKGRMSRMLSSVEAVRLQLSESTGAEKKSHLGQFFTSARTASFMAGLFFPTHGNCRLLDPGAGIGSLSAAFLEKRSEGEFDFESVEVDAFEIDHTLHPFLTRTMSQFDDREVSTRIHGEDFIHRAVDWLSGSIFSEAIPRYTHVILNPPYKKIASNSEHRLALRKVGIETVNMYSGFVALALALTAPGGQVVAIIPRSFCNGPYFKSFREFIFEHAAIRRIHLFESRRNPFRDDGVLQENVIIHLERGGWQGSVNVSTSTDDSFSDLVVRKFPFERIVPQDHSGRFIHIPTSREKGAIESSTDVSCTLDELGIQVSTGPVVDFRVKEHLRSMPEPNSVPLLYPGHFSRDGVVWPIESSKKPNAIHCNSDTGKWLYPNGYYCVVRRFSSKEQRRRVEASVVDPSTFPDAPMLGFENHLNLFHSNKQGLPEALARGLAVFLNTTAVDEFFRHFNGHTQVNATDLKLMKYPNRSTLTELGNWAMKQSDLTQMSIDEKFGTLVA